jgi:putative tributyrin esterase
MRRKIVQCTLIVCACLTTACSSAVVSRDPLSSGARADHGIVREESFFSNALGVQKHALVYVPPSYSRETTRRYPVVYYLHGLSGSEADWMAKGNINVVADSLFNAGTPEMIVVMPDGDDGWYTTWIRQLAFRTCADTLHNEAPDRFCVGHERYDEYIAHDVVRFIDSHYRTLASREHRGVGGLSMGGYGAVTLALHFSDIFAAAASHSGVLSPMYIGPHPFAGPPTYGASPEDIRPTTGFFARYLNFWGPDIARWREADPAHIAQVLKQRGGTLPALFIDCGVDDGFLDQNRAFHFELTRLGVAHSYAEWPGAHTWRYWSTHVRESLAWMGDRVGR